MDSLIADPLHVHSEPPTSAQRAERAPGRHSHWIKLKAERLLGYDPEDPKNYEDRQWHWNRACPGEPRDIPDYRDQVGKIRLAILVALWKFRSVREYMLTDGIVQFWERDSDTPPLAYLAWAYHDYAEIPEAIQVIAVYSDGDYGYRAENIHDHSLYLIPPDVLQSVEHALDGAIKQAKASTFTVSPDRGEV